ncbi:MAG: SAM-dependent methyltransferase [Bacteroidales bacterium]|nr:SAM-dependent methyltransferase [Bacteroidales bacterium]
MATEKSYGKIYLFPTLLGGDDISYCIPDYNIDIIRDIRFFIVEELRTARRFLRKVIADFPIDDCHFELLNEHTIHINTQEMLLPALQGHPMAILSEAGLPCVADPGSDLILEAHHKKITVVPLVGASSLLMALMASGLSGQHFCFHGYLPTDKHDLIIKIRNIERQSAKNNEAQIFIEAPYRNMQLLQTLLETCAPSTYLCIASNLTLYNESIRSQTIQDWRKASLPSLHKQNTVFILQQIS